MAHAGQLVICSHPVGPAKSGRSPARAPLVASPSLCRGVPLRCNRGSAVRMTRGLPQPCRSMAAQVLAGNKVAAGVVPGHLQVMISGPPAAGKGTQCAKIVEKYGLVHISVGDLLRAEVAAGSPAGTRAKAFMDAGQLVPNEVVVDMVVDRLAQPDVKAAGWLLDGYPRSAEQAEAIQEAGIQPDIFILVEVPDDVLVQRVSGRRMDPSTGEIYHLKFKPPPEDAVPRLVQRSDDTEESLRTRLKTYHSNVESVIGYYEDRVLNVDGVGSMEDVFAQIDGALSVMQDHEEAAA